MKLIPQSILALTLGSFMASAFAAPAYLITHNKTNAESNAYIAGTIPSPYPTPANKDAKVYWNMVRIACHNHTNADGTCSALIKMETNTANPVELGYLTLNLETGDINPKELPVKNGYRMRIDGPGEATITKVN